MFLSLNLSHKTAEYISEQKWLAEAQFIEKPVLGQMQLKFQKQVSAQNFHSKLYSWA